MEKAKDHMCWCVCCCINV